jgi:patatin-like phospholipase/acyl hydrolase
VSYRILSIDGGGIRGVLAAQMLVNIQHRLQQPLNEYFDLISGTSTGSMLAAAIACGLSCQDIVELYRKKAKNIFPYTSRWSLKRLPLILEYGLSGPKFSEKGLVDLLKNLFGNTTFSDITDPKLLITSYDTIGRQPIIFKSWRDRFDDICLWEACVCSTAAPTFFPAHKIIIGGEVHSAIDGGLAANNPTACAVAEAIRLGNSLADLQVISIGTGSATRTIRWEDARTWGPLQWIWDGRVVKVMTDAPAEVYHYITDYVIGDTSRYLRLQFPLDRQLTDKRLSDDMDDASDENINNLIEAAEAYLSIPLVSQALDACLRDRPVPNPEI